MPPHRQHRRHLVVACFGFIARGAACALNLASGPYPYPLPLAHSLPNLSPAAAADVAQTKKDTNPALAPPAVVGKLKTVVRLRQNVC